MKLYKKFIIQLQQITIVEGMVKQGCLNSQPITKPVTPAQLAFFNDSGYIGSYYMII